MRNAVLRLLACLTSLSINAKQIYKVDPVAVGYVRMVNLSGAVPTVAVAVSTVTVSLTVTIAVGVVTVGVTGIVTA